MGETFRLVVQRPRPEDVIKACDRETQRLKTRLGGSRLQEHDLLAIACIVAIVAKVVQIAIVVAAGQKYLSAMNVV